MAARSGRCRFRIFSGVGLGVALAVVLALGLAGLASPQRARADDGWSAPRTVYVPESGHTINGLFLDAWRADGALLGNPITQELQVSNRLGFAKYTSAKITVQYYDNVALMYLPQQADGWKVQTLQLGREAIRRVAPQDRGAFSTPGACGSLPSDLCKVFPETGHTLRFRFKFFWEANGGSPLLGLPLSEQFTTADGHTVQYFERAVLQWKAGEEVTPWPLGRQAAQRLNLETRPVAQANDIPTYSEALFVPPAPTLAVGGRSSDHYGPGPQRGAYKEIVVSLSAQELWAYEGGQLVMDTLVSTGRPGFDTPTGDFEILDKIPVHTMEGVLGGEYYNVPDVPDVMYFTDRGHALHGTYWHHNFGEVMSHGCVNLPMDVADWMYDWAPIGTPVTIIG